MAHRLLLNGVTFPEDSMEYGHTTKVPSNVQEMPAQAEATYQNMRAAMEEYVESATDMAREAAAYADRQVQQNPWTAVGLGFGVGVVFGLLAAMAARSQHSALDHFR
jgi:ElaB/YqjD/DUF883 family membrane-anchored ribosome-binding protein